MISSVKFTNWYTLILCIVLSSCTSPVSEPRIQLLGAAQTKELLTSAKRAEPAGDAVVNIFTSDTTTTITTTQLFSFRLNDNTGGSTGMSCVGVYKTVGPVELMPAKQVVVLQQKRENAHRWFAQAAAVYPVPAHQEPV